jgi:tRNA threonylcarbamoyladenosine biosynthesis protein TsaE
MHCRTASAADTEEAAARLARARPPGADFFAALYLSGDLGAGKTTWARGFLKACGVGGIVRSPTYTLVELYDLGGAVTAVHLDLYRLRDESELEALGLRDWAQPGFVWLIEWPERASGRLPPADLLVSLSAAADAHDIYVSAGSALGERWLLQACA